MRLFRLLPQMLLCGAMVLGLASSTFAALELRMASATVSGPGPVDLDVFIGWDGNGTNLISSINFDVVLPAEVTLPDAVAADLPDPMGFGALRGVSANSVAFTNLAANVPALAVGDNLFTTLRFNVNATSGTFPIGINLVEAGQGGAVFFVDITDQFTVSGGSISVVPEPSSLALIGLAGFGLGFRRNRRLVG